MLIRVSIQESTLRNDLKREKEIIHEDVCYGFIYTSETEEAS